MDDARTDLDGLGVRRQPGGVPEGVVAPRLGDPHAVVSQPFGLLHLGDHVAGLVGSPITEGQAELELFR